MSQRRLIDTNLIIRYLVQDQHATLRLRGKLFDACVARDDLVVLSVVVAECVFVLESF